MQADALNISLSRSLGSQNQCGGKAFGASLDPPERTPVSRGNPEKPEWREQLRVRSVPVGSGWFRFRFHEPLKASLFSLYIMKNKME